MKKFFTLLALLFFTPLALADSSSLLHPAAITNFTDLSVNYLSQIFGTVGGVLEGSGSQMMGKLFYVLNNGILLAAVIVIVYSVLMGTIRLASEGVSVAQGKSTLFSLLKLAIGIALIIPNPTTGYSALQSIVMKVVVEGAGLADSVWDNGLNYLKKGGLMWSAPKDGSVGSQANVVSAETIKAMFTKDNAFASQIFANEVCMIGSRDPLTSQSGANGNDPVSANAQTRPMYEVWADEGNHTFNFPGLTDESVGQGSACGSVSWNVQKACDSNNPSSCATARQAMSALVTDMLPLAQKFYCQQVGPGSPNCTDVSFPSNDYAYSALFNGMLSYYSTMNMYAETHDKSVNDSEAAFIKGAKSEGWLNAGRYYWDLMRFSNNSEEQANLASYITSAIGPNSQEISKYALKSIVIGAENKLAGGEDSYVINNNHQITSGFQDYVNQVYGQATGGVDGGSSGTGKPLIIGAAAAGVIAPAYLNPGVGATLTAAAAGLDVISQDFDNPNPNPIQFLYNLGQNCLKLTIAIWVIGGVAIGATMLGFGVCQASSPLAVMGQTVASWFTPMITMIAMMLWVSGFFLSYYVPLYPFMIFLFASIGWFISVIEAMVAAPLVALGLTHPENHDFLGKAEQAVVLLLGVFIQPSLLVIGLIAGIIFSFVSFHLLIYSYSGFMVDIMGNSSTSKHGTDILAAAVNSPMYSSTILLTQPLLLVVFCVLTYTLLTQSFSLVFLLRDNVMRWIGAPGSGLASPEQLTQETKGAITGMGKSTGEGVGQGMSGSIRSLNDSGKEIRKEMDDNAASSVQSG